MSKAQEKAVPQGGWNFQLNKVGKSDSLRDPMGYKCSIADVVVKSSTGKGKNLT
jgi:hypothetical protein